MKKLGFRFSAIPRDRHPEWFEVPLFTRMLGHELYAASCDDSGVSKPIPVASSWRTSLCRTLCIEPEDRPAVSQSFSAMEKRGLIKVEDDAVHIVWNPKDKLFKPTPAKPELPPPCDPAEPPLMGGCRGAAGGLWSETPRNDSTHALQIREEKIREEKSARAREDEELDHQIRIGFSKRLENAAKAIPNQRSLGAAVASLTPWIEKTAALRKLSEHELTERLLDGFFASESAKAKSYPPAFLAQNPLEYLDARPQLRAARVPDGIPPIRNFGPKPKEAI